MLEFPQISFCLLRVQLDDQLLVELDLNEFFSLGLCDDPALQVIAVDFEPVRRGSVRGGVAGSQNSGIVLTFFADFDDVVYVDLKRGNVDLAAVDHQMAVTDQLAGLAAAGAEAHAIDYVVQT